MLFRHSAILALVAASAAAACGSSDTPDVPGTKVTTTFSYGCGSLDSFDGWYAKLFVDTTDAVQFDPPIADVHTDPNSGSVLEVGTTKPRLMVVTVESCSGPHAYVGLASSYHEQIQQNYNRLTDDQWLQQIVPNPPPDPPWLNGLVEPR